MRRGSVRQAQQPAHTAELVAGDHCEATHAWKGSQRGDLGFKVGDMLLVIDVQPDGWLYGQLVSGTGVQKGSKGQKKGVFPAAYMKRTDLRQSALDVQRARHRERMAERRRIEKAEKHRHMLEVRQKIAQAIGSAWRLERFMMALDSDGNGVLDRDEFRVGILEHLDVQGVTQEDLDELFDDLDDNGNGELDYEEFEQIVKFDLQTEEAKLAFPSAVDWEEVVEEGSGEKYYYNNQTELTTWQKPVELTVYERQTKASVQIQRSARGKAVRIAKKQEIEAAQGQRHAAATRIQSKARQGAGKRKASAVRARAEEKAKLEAYLQAKQEAEEREKAEKERDERREREERERKEAEEKAKREADEQMVREMEERQRRKKKQMLQLRKRIAQAVGDEEGLDALMRAIDTDNSGTVDKGEFRAGIMRHFGKPQDSGEVGQGETAFESGDLDRLFEQLDEAGSGELDAAAFEKLVTFDLKVEMAAVEYPAYCAWQQSVDPGTGAAFYANVETGQTTWKKPDALTHHELHRQSSIRVQTAARGNRARRERRRREEERARREAERARREAEERARREAEERARREAEAQARTEAENQRQRELEAQIRRETEERVRREMEAELAKERERRAQLEAEARKTAEEQARREAEEQARREAEEQARQEAEEKARQEAEEEQARRKAAEEQAYARARGEAAVAIQR
eukprot:g164.t1